MKKVRVNLEKRSYAVNIASGMLTGNLAEELSKIIRGKKTFIITDSNVDGLYSDAVEGVLKENSIYTGKYVFPAGEEHKNLATVETGYHAVVKSGLDRNSIIVALGGGVCGDLAGFIAATYMRGIKFIQIPTTLLAMVDSSVGGKTGIDLNEGKNLVGAFWQPAGVFIDTKVLATLPDRELACGLAEVAKYGVIYDEKFFEYLESNIDGIKQKKSEVFEHIIGQCCSIKAKIVSQDEKENSLRAILNFGHTFGHAIETVSSYSGYKHGEAVAIGMLIACELGVILGSVNSKIKERIQKLLQNFSLPIKADSIDSKSILSAMARDKKAKDGELQLIIPDTKIGQVKIVSEDDTLILKAIGTHL